MQNGMYDAFVSASAISYNKKIANSAWGIYITIGVWAKKNNTPILLVIESLLKLLYIGLRC